MQVYRFPRSVPSRRGSRLIFLSVLVIVLLCTAFVSYAYSKVTQPRTSYSSEQSFVISRGESLAVVAERLERAGIIRSALAFQLYVAIAGSSSRVQAGTFVLNSNMSIVAVADRLTRGRGAADEVRVTFLEGQQSREYADILARSGVVTAEQFLASVRDYSNASDYDFLRDKPAGQSLEGYLFPDTYHFKKSATPDEVVAILLTNFGRKLTPSLREEITRQGKRIYDVVTMASLIEGEVGRNVEVGTVLSETERKKLEEERRLVAGVFYNRLSRDYPLQSDATVSYVLGTKKARPTIAETQISSPYNTYQIVGLPRGPINNPSEDALLAAIYPAQTDYFYFLSKPSGEMVFSKTLEEHNANKLKYLK